MRNPFRGIRSPVSWYRMAQKLHTLRVPILPWCIDQFIRLNVAGWLPHTVKAGKGLELGYGGLGCVIHSAAELGDDVHIGTHVTIGGNGTEFGLPTIGNNVYIGTGAKLLGPIMIGDNSIVGANAVVTSDVMPNSVVAGIPARVIRSGIDPKSYLYHLRQKAA